MNALHDSIALALLGKPNVKTDEYYKCLGKFIAEYANVEAALRTALWFLAGLQAPIAQAVLSGVRTEDAISYIYRIGQSQRWTKEKTEKFKFVFDQVQVINKLRNDIVHRGASLQADGTWLSTNIAVVHIPERIINTTVTAEILVDATNDLFDIRLLLVSLVWPERLSPEMQTAFNETQLGAWRYKLAPQGRKSSTNRKARQKQKRQPQSSQQ